MNSTDQKENSNYEKKVVDYISKSSFFSPALLCAQIYLGQKEDFLWIYRVSKEDNSHQIIWCRLMNGNIYADAATITELITEKDLNRMFIYLENQHSNTYDILLLSYIADFYKYKLINSSNDERVTLGEEGKRNKEDYYKELIQDHPEAKVFSSQEEAKKYLNSILLNSGR